MVSRDGEEQWREMSGGLEAVRKVVPGAVRSREASPAAGGRGSRNSRTEGGEEGERGGAGDKEQLEGGGGRVGAKQVGAVTAEESKVQCVVMDTDIGSGKRRRELGSIWGTGDWGQ